MTAYHEIASDKAEDVLKHGLKRTSRGDKGDDQSIIKTDEFLDAHCPAELKDRGVSRDDNVYAYVCVDDAIVDITDGSIVPLKDFISRS
ncbi:MAG TPA: hypothetical protein VF597_00500 [Candidatus Saccharimonadales bacterium]